MERAATAAEPLDDLLPAPVLSLQRAVRFGLIGGMAAVVVAAIGMVETFEARTLIDPFLALGLTTLYLASFTFGFVAGSPPPEREGFAKPKAGLRSLAAGAIAGVLAGVVLSAFMLLADAVNLRNIFVSVSPQLLELLTFGKGLGTGILLVLVVSTAVGVAGSAVHLIPAQVRRPIMYTVMWVLLVGLLQSVIEPVFRGLGLPSLIDVLYEEAGGLRLAGVVIVAAAVFLLSFFLGGKGRALQGRLDALPAQRRRSYISILLLVAAAIVYMIPRVVGPFLSEVLDLAGLYLLMALGLNIVIGYAGLLDLGYVAFFAVGAYTTAILTSPNSPRFTPEMTLWASLPFVVLAAALAGLLVGTPVLRMRGDYLAIVTLGFGEIARILLNSDALKETFGGAQGIINIPNMVIGPLTVRGPEVFFYPIFIFAILAGYVSLAIQNSRMGRAWMAMREDELVAETMGVNIVAAKLSAFVVGASLASIGGALFAVKVGSVFPSSFNIVVSITILVLIIVGGMGSVPGVTVGALALVALPELLREFNEYKFLMYGILLIFMMLKRPEGFIPSKRRALELHQDEVLQDAWLQIYGDEETGPQEEGV
ncbi:MAG: leucine/isoleucine/valine transporter permease subunit [Acidimicrobiia bacterium]|nr:leucine/isoleucine/valine transporter permease subunit [Acidimicrobiia bacterium]